MTASTEKFDVCIVGASIAGNYLCYLLSKTNLKVVIIEEHKEVGLPFQCAGIISQKITQLIELPENIIKNQVNVAKIVSPSGAAIKLTGNERPYIIDRVLLDKHFYNLAKINENNMFYLGEKVKSFEYCGQGQEKIINVTTSKRVLKVKLLIGCDGPLSLIGNSLKVKNKVLYATQIRIKAQFNENEAVLAFNPQWKELFGWIVPEGQNIFRIGIAASHNIKQNFDKFLKMLNINYEDKIDQQGGLIPYGMMNKCTFNNILLLGDAAGQVKATTGGGIIMLITAAKIASECIRKCFIYDNFTKKFLKKHYEKPCRASIGKELKIHYLIRKLLESFNKDDFDTFFKVIKMHKIEQIISLYGDMDFPRELAFKIIKSSLFVKFLFKFLLRKPILLLKMLFFLIS